MNRKISTGQITATQHLDLGNQGKYLRILRVVPNLELLVHTNEGDSTALQGEELIATNLFSSGYLNVALLPAGVDSVTVTYYIGDKPFIGNAKTEPSGSIVTTDWFTLANPGGASFLTVNGVLTVSGVTYRRKSITVCNISGSNIAGVAAAADGNMQAGTFTAADKKSLVPNDANGTKNGPIFPLPSANGHLYYPVGPWETEDTIIIQALNGSTIDVAIQQVWLPIHL